MASISNYPVSAHENSCSNCSRVTSLFGVAVLSTIVLIKSSYIDHGLESVASSLNCLYTLSPETLLAMSTGIVSLSLSIRYLNKFRNALSGYYLNQRTYLVHEADLRTHQIARAHIKKIAQNVRLFLKTNSSDQSFSISNVGKFRIYSHQVQEVWIQYLDPNSKFLTSSQAKIKRNANRKILFFTDCPIHFLGKENSQKQIMIRPDDVQTAYFFHKNLNSLFYSLKEFVQTHRQNWAFLELDTKDKREFFFIYRKNGEIWIHYFLSFEREKIEAIIATLK